MNFLDNKKLACLKQSSRAEHGSRLQRGDWFVRSIRTFMHRAGMHRARRNLAGRVGVALLSSVGLRIAGLSLGMPGAVALGFGLLGAGCVSSSPALAQQASALTAVYGRGVHAYFDGNTSLADQYFTQVINAGSSDPRPFYFRAMVRLGMGRQFEAENDMRVGAAYEARNPGALHALGRSLQRVQGPGRRTLEQFRRQARLDRQQQGQQQTQQRYEQLDRRGPAVLRRAVPVPLGQPIEPPRELAAPNRPTAGVVATPPQMQAPVINTPRPAEETSGPARDAITAQPIPAGSGSRNDPDDLFGAPAPAFPAAATPATTPATTSAGRPTTGIPDSGTTADDLFGSPEPVTPPPALVPAPAEADPFGELPAAAPVSTPEARPEVAPEARPEVAPEARPEVAPEARYDADDPFGEPPPSSTPTTETLPGPAATEEPASAGPATSEAAPAETADEEADPFGESAASSAGANDADPFGATAEDAPMDEVEPADESSAADDEVDPFGDPAGDSAPADDPPAGEPPVGDAPADEPSAGEPSAGEPPVGDNSAGDSAADDPPAEEDDPFGEMTEAASEGAEESSEPVEGEPADEEPAADEPTGDEPAGDDSAGDDSAGESDDDDPFGEF